MNLEAFDMNLETCRELKEQLNLLREELDLIAGLLFAYYYPATSIEC